MKLRVKAIVAGAVLLLGGCKPTEGGTVTPPAPEAEVSREALKAERDRIYNEALAAAEASHGAGRPALWTLADEDTTIYMMGTVHLLRPDLDWRSDEINAAIADADTLVFEADTTSQAAAADMMSFVSQQGMFTDGRQLTSLLNEAEKAELESALKHVGLPMGAIQPMRPWFAAINLSVMQMQKDGFDPNSGVEQVLEAEGRAAGKDFAYLETVNQQLGLIAGLPDDEQVEFLISAAEAVEEGSEVLDALVAEWADGDVNGLGVLMANEKMMGSDKVYDALLRVRNEAWVPQIEAMLDDPGTVLVAVGAAHLAGEDSVVMLLRAKGHEVTGP